MQDVKPIPAGAVFAMLIATAQKCSGADREWFAEITISLERASHDDPLFAHPLGPAATAAILVALSGYRTGLKRASFGKTGHGLFNILAPPGSGERGMLGTSYGSAYVAVDQIRNSFKSCASFPWPERLAGFFFANELGATSVTLEHRFASAAVMATAAQLLKTHVPEATGFVERSGIPLLEASAA